MSDPQTITIAAPKANVDPDEVFISLADRQLSGWENVEITRGIELCPSVFRVGLTEYSPVGSDSMILRPGEACTVLLGKDRVLTGFVDRHQIELAPRSHGIEIVGRGKCQDLVDCSALWPGQVISNSTVLQVAQRLAQPFGITVTGQGDTPVGSGSVLPYIVVPIGESCWSVIERLCAVAGLLAYEQPDGSLYVGPGFTVAQSVSSGPLARRAASGFREGVNVLSARAMFANDARYSQYLAHRVSVEQFRNVSSESYNLVATATDDGVNRYRVLAFVAEAGNEPDLPQAQATAYWEAGRRWGRSRMVHLTTDAWRDADGVLYEPNTIVTLELPTLKIVGQDWIVSEVTYRKSEAGTTCDLTLMPPQAFLLRPTLPPYVIAPDQAALPPNLAQP